MSAPRYSALGPTVPLAHAPAWKDRLGAWHSLAGYGSDLGSLRPRWRSRSSVEGQELHLSLTWRGALDGCQAIQADYCLTQQSVRIRYTLSGQLTGLRAEIPLFAFDGEQSAEILQGASDCLSVSFRGSQLQMQVISGNARLVMSDEQAATRTGLLRKAWAETSDRSIEIELTLT